MFTHEQIWNGVEKLARLHGLSPSRLAKLAGLDPTCFNKSKRYTNVGQPRWLSTDSLNKTLVVTKTSLSDFAQLVENE